MIVLLCHVVRQGRWMYECVLETAGVMQLGWSTIDCLFTNEHGVGDSRDSYAYDGQRKKLWNEGSVDYGEQWIIGDVIGFGIDLDVGTIEIFRNGRSLGVALSCVRSGPGLAYFPSISLAYGERVRINFGATPLSFPQPTYLPVQVGMALSTGLSCTYMLASACIEHRPGQVPHRLPPPRHRPRVRQVALSCS